MIGDTEPRYTKDLDLWTEPLEANVQKLLIALARFGAPARDVHPSDLTGPDIFQIGICPVRIDIHDVRIWTRFCSGAEDILKSKIAAVELETGERRSSGK